MGKFTIRSFAALSLLLLYCMTVNAYEVTEVTFGDFKYYIYTTKKTATLKECLWKTAFSITVPEKIVVAGRAYTVTETTSGAFSGCTNLEKVTLPKTLTEIGQNCFDGCTSLVDVNIPDGCTVLTGGCFMNCKKLREIKLPKTLKRIGNEAFSGCSSLKSVVVPECCTEISWRAFENCSSLTDVTLCGAIKSIEEKAFYGCTSLASINLPNTLKTIGENAFAYCSSLRGIDLPKALKEVGETAFQHCSSLTKIVLPQSINKMGLRVFSYCSSLTEVVSYIQDYDNFVGVDQPLIIKTLSRFKQGFSSSYPNAKIVVLDDYRIKVSKYANAFVIEFIKGADAVDDLKFMVHLNTTSNKEISYKNFYADENGRCIFGGLKAEEYISYSHMAFNDDFESEGHGESVKLPESKLRDCFKFNAGLHSLDIEMIDDTGASTNLYGAYEVGLTFNEKTYEKGDFPLHFDNLGIRTYTFTGYALTDAKHEFSENGSRYEEQIGVAVGDINPYVYVKTSPTVLDIKFSFRRNLFGTTLKSADLSVSEKWSRAREEIFDVRNGSCVVTGLIPETQYNLTFVVKNEEGDSWEISKTAKTKSLTLTTLPPRGVSATCSIVAAETNMSDEETRAGFQWKKYDAPETLKPSEGYAAIYEGRLEGYLKRLQPTAYYNVRPFYKSAEGNYYYGEWVTFDPSDFSYFEPTVHTYPADALADGTVTLRGYMLPGSDEVTEQGFEYWRTSGASAKARRITATLAPATGVETVIATGQRMSAVLKDLVPSATYCFRSYAKTANGTTYGEEQTFTAPASATGIESVEADGGVRVTGIYDVSGRPRQTKQRGLNIIRYSDGTTRTVVVR